jgi:hypothetical protein
VTRAPLLAAALLLAAAPAGAQRTWNGGFAVAGGASADSRFLDDGAWTFAAGWETRWALGEAFRAGVRGVAEYSRFSPNEAAWAEELGGDVILKAGPTTVVGTGLDLVGGFETGDFGMMEAHRVGAYGFAGIRDGTAIPAETNSGAGASWGAGVTWTWGGGAGMLLEWFQTGGFDDEMLRVTGLRLGVRWKW